MAAQLVYAIVPTGKKMSFEGSGPDQGNGPIRTVPHHDIAAVVGTSAVTSLWGPTKDEAVRHLLAHERVVEAVMASLPVLPVKFGTVLPDEAAVRRLLVQGERLFRRALAALAGRVQVEVVVQWNLQEVFDDIRNEEPIARLRAQLAGRSPDETLAERIALGQMVQASLAQRRDELRQRLLPRLRQVAHDSVVNAAMDDNTVLNVGLLMEPAGGEALDRQLARLDEEFASRLTFRCVGPLPPYSFATVQIGTPSFAEVEGACRLLGLANAATPGEIRHAFRRRASLVHPDVNREDPEAKSRMAQLNGAYRLLTAYAENWGRSAGSWPAAPAGRPPRTARGSTGPRPARPCAFTQEAVERMLLIEIRRQDVLGEVPAGPAGA